MSSALEGMLQNAGTGVVFQAVEVRLSDLFVLYFCASGVGSTRVFKNESLGALNNIH